MMNWQTIKNKYPLAYQKAYEYGFFIELDEGGIIEMCYDMTFRDFYDFFDENNIIIELMVEDVDEILACGCCHDHSHYTNKFAFTIYKEFSKGKYKIEYEDVDYKSRQQSEEQAFIKAFEILEKK